jgi:hypothetical protein
MNLEILPGAFSNETNRTYEFTIQTNHLNQVFNQTVRIIVGPGSTVPIVTLG